MRIVTIKHQHALVLAALTLCMKRYSSVLCRRSVIRPTSAVVGPAVSLLLLKLVPSTLAFFVPFLGASWCRKGFSVRRDFEGFGIRHSFFLPPVDVRRRNTAANTWKNMLIRVRTNRGIWRIPELDEEKSTLQDILEHIHEMHPGISLSHPLSSDPSCKSPLDASLTLKEQDLGHGSMIYCLLEDNHNHQECSQTGTNNKENNKTDECHSSNGAAGIQSSLSNQIQRKEKPKSDAVVDLLSSDDDGDASSQSSVNLLESSGDEHEAKKKKAIRSKAESRFVPSSSVMSPICLLDDTDDESTSSSLDYRENKKRRSSAVAGTGDISKKVKTERKPSATNDRVTTFQIASYNIWFGPHGSEDLVHPEERMTAIVDELRRCHSSKCPLSMVGFQEVTAELAEFLRPQLILMGYKWHVQPHVMSMPGSGMYGCAIAVHKDLKVLESNFIPYSNTAQFRGILYVRTNSIFFATTHLESYAGPQFTGAKERQVQAKEIANFCRGQLLQHKGTLQHAIFTGDLNWDDERTTRSKTRGDNVPLLPLISEGENWTDAWLDFSQKNVGTNQARRPAAAGGNKEVAGYTYDAKENPMLGGNLRRRFDRCLVLSNQNSHNKLIHNFELLGKKAIPNLTYVKRNPYNDTSRTVPVAPSDHFGIAVTIDLLQGK